jgi:hypothetical protein
VRKSGRPSDRKQRRVRCAQGETRLGAIIRRVNPEVMATVVRSIRANVQRAQARAKWQGAHLELLCPGPWKTHRVAFERTLRPVLRNLRRLDRVTSASVAPTLRKPRSVGQPQSRCKEGPASVRDGPVIPALSAVFHNGNSKTTKGLKPALIPFALRGSGRAALPRKGESISELFSSLLIQKNVLFLFMGRGVRGVTGECEWDHRFGLELC